MGKNFDFFPIILVLSPLLISVPHVEGLAEGEAIAVADFSTDDGAAGWVVQGVDGSMVLEQQGERLFATERDDDDKFKMDAWFFVSPKRFVRGNVASAYGGFLTFTLGHFEYDTGGYGVMGRNLKTGAALFDVVLVSSDPKVSVGVSGVFVDDGAISHVYSVRLDEEFVSSGGNKWVLLSKPTVNAEQAMLLRCLQTLQSVQIRGGYYMGVESTFLSTVSISIGQTNKGGSFEGKPIDEKLGSAENYVLINGKYIPRRASARKGSTAAIMDSPTMATANGVSAPSAIDAANFAYLDDSPSVAAVTCTSNARLELLFNRPGCEVNNMDSCPASAFADTSVVHNLLHAESLLAGQPHIFNQNIGPRATPIKKPFNKEYVFKSVPHICSAATLEIQAHGDLRGPEDYIQIYGEDDVLLGIVFAGNLSQVFEDERVSQWSETRPYLGAVVIPQDKMTLYAADSRITFRLQSPRGHLDPEAFSGTQGLPGELTTTECDNPPCDLSGKVIIRSLRIIFTPTPCYVSKLNREAASSALKNAAGQWASLPLTFSTAAGDLGQPATDGVLSVTTDGNVVPSSNYFNVLVGGSNFNNSVDMSFLTSSSSSSSSSPLLASSSSSSSLPINASDIGSFFHRPEFQDRLAQPQNLPTWGGAATVTPRFTDSISIPRDLLAAAAGGGQVKVSVATQSPVLLDQTIFSPLTLSYPLRHCFQQTITSGQFFNFRLDRPAKLQLFSNPGMPAANSDVHFQIVVQWPVHARYSNFAGGNNEETPLVRADSRPMGVGLDWNNYPDKISAHKEFPHGHSYLQLRNGFDGEFISNLFLGDYSQYAPEGYLVDSAFIPRDLFNTNVKSNQNGQFSFSLWLPPGDGILMIRSISFGFVPAAKENIVSDDFAKTIPFHPVM